MDDLLRYGWASARLDAHPDLHRDWAESADPAVRRALMRSPALPPDVAGLIVSTRRSGMHTLGANPEAPLDLLRHNPSAMRRRAHLDALLPGGLADVERDPNRSELVDAGSGTVDLAIAHAERTTEGTGLAIAARRDPPADPWVVALLIRRFGARIEEAVAAHATRPRMRAVRTLAAEAP